MNQNRPNQDRPVRTTKPSILTDQEARVLTARRGRYRYARTHGGDVLRYAWDRQRERWVSF